MCILRLILGRPFFRIDLKVSFCIVFFFFISEIDCGIIQIATVYDDHIVNQYKEPVQRILPFATKPTDISGKGLILY